MSEPTPYDHEKDKKRARGLADICKDSVVCIEGQLKNGIKLNGMVDQKLF